MIRNAKIILRTSILNFRIWFFLENMSYALLKARFAEKLLLVVMAFQLPNNVNSVLPLYELIKSHK